MDFSKGLLVLSHRLPRRRLLSRGLVLILGLTLGLILGLIPWRYEKAEISVLYQVLYFSSQLYTVVRAMLIVPMELAILGVISCSGI